MGTRADFYVGRGMDAEWLGSIAWDGDYGTVLRDLGVVTSEVAWRSSVCDYLRSLDDATFPEQGWPWPWESSRTTNFAYAWDEQRLWWSCFGSPWVSAEESMSDGFDYDYEAVEETGTKVDFPDMTDRQRVAYDGRSGVIWITA